MFLSHAPDSQLFHEDIFERLRCFLNSLDLSVCEDQANGTSTEVATSTSTPLKTPANHRLQMPSSTDVLSHQVDDDDTGCFLLTPPSSVSKKVSLWLPVAKLKKRLCFLPEKKFDNAISFQVVYFTLRLFKPYIFIILQFVRQRS